jgi:hypothetical protein
VFYEAVRLRRASFRASKSPFAHHPHPGTPGAARASVYSWRRLCLRVFDQPLVRKQTAVASLDSFQSRKTLTVGDKSYTYYSIPHAAKAGLADATALPFAMKVLLENLLRFEDDRSVKKDDISATVAWLGNKGKTETEIAFRPSRVLMQDFTGVRLAATPRRSTRWCPSTS